MTLPREAFGFAAVDLLLEEIAGTVGERHGDARAVII